MIKIEDCDFSVRLQRFAKVVGAKTIDELRTKLESDEPVYIPGSLIASRGAQYFNKSRIIQELDAYQHHVLDRDPDHTLWTNDQGGFINPRRYNQAFTAIE